MFHYSLFIDNKQGTQTPVTPLYNAGLNVLLKINNIQSLLLVNRYF